MKIFITICIFTKFLFQQIALPAQGYEQETGDERSRLLVLEHEWLAAELALDTFFIASILDSSFTGISEYGIHSKQEELADMYTTMNERKTNNIHIDTFGIEEAVVNLYHNTAVVTFVLRTFRNENGILTQRRTRFYDVWIRKEGKWLAVSSQGSTIRE